MHGDSKTATLRDWSHIYDCYAEAQTGVGWHYVANLALGGLTVQNARNTIDADLAAIPASPAPEFAMINFGANDVKALPAEAAWEANYLYLCDAIHTKWPACQIYIMRPWDRDYPTECDTVAGWIDTIVAARPTFMAVGPDERVFLEGGDNGVTYTEDGTHPNEAGRVATALQWIATTL